MRVMTFNIRVGNLFDGVNRWYKRRDLVFDTIRACGAHLVGIQEATSVQLHEMLDALPTFAAIAGRRYAGLRGSHAPILFDAARFEPGPSGDFWLQADPHGRKARGWDAAVPRICTWAVFADRETGSRRFAVLNSHFDQRGVVARVESARLVVRKLAELAHVPRLFTADLNANETSDALGVLKAAGMRDSFREVDLDGEANTFHGFRGRGAKSLGKIDYILCDESWKVLGSEVIRTNIEGRYPSDHFPMVADLELVSKPAGNLG
jgi:endonuclease/exonuclease/phosphatase family metal-dependent hydrolase